MSLKSQGFGELSNRIHPLAQEEAPVPAASGEPLGLVSQTCVCAPLPMLSTSPCLSSSPQINAPSPPSPTPTRLSVAPCPQSMCAPHELCLKRANICVRGAVSLLGPRRESCSVHPSLLPALPQPRRAPIFRMFPFLFLPKQGLPGQGGLVVPGVGVGDMKGQVWA